MSSGQCDADRQACKEDSQALVFATKIFLVLQLAVLPGMWLWLQKNPALSARAAFISRQGVCVCVCVERGGGRGGWAQKDGGRCFPRPGGKSGFLFQRAADVHTAHRSPGVCCEIARHLEEARREERTREQRREMRREEQQRGSCLDGVPGKRPAALSDFKCPSCEIALSNTNNLTACLRPTPPPHTLSFYPALAVLIS